MAIDLASAPGILRKLALELAEKSEKLQKARLGRFFLSKSAEETKDDWYIW